MRSRSGWPAIAALSAVGLLLGVACRDSLTGSAAVGRATIDLTALFQGTTTAPVVDPVTRIHITVTRSLPAPSTVLVDEFRNFTDPGRGVEAQVTISIPLDGEDDEFDVLIEALDANGVALFRVGPLRFRTSDFSRGPVSRAAQLEYVGPGSDAVRVVASPSSLTLEPGGSGTIEVRVFGPNDTPIARAPLEWSVTSGSDVVSVDQTGRVTAANRTGSATVVVKALTTSAPSANVQVDVSSAPATITLELVSGGGQSALPGAQLPSPIVVRARKGDGSVASGITLMFSGGSVNPATAVTDANGQAQTEWTLSGTPGAQTLQVTAVNALTPLQVGATAVQAALSLVSGGDQSGTVGFALAQPIIVSVMAGATPVAGRTVTFTITLGGGGVSQTNVTTDANGLAQTLWTLGAFLGAQSVTAATPDATGSPLAIGATGTANNRVVQLVSFVPSAIEPFENATVTARVLTGVNGLPVANAQVTFTSTGTGNTFTPVTAATTSTGQAQTVFSSSQAEVKNLTAASGSATSAAAALPVAIRNNLGTTLLKVSGDNQVVVYGTNFPLPMVVQVRDTFGLPVPNAFVDFGSAIGNLRRVTDANGNASQAYSLPNDPATYPPNLPLPVVVQLVGTGVTVTFTYTAIFPPVNATPPAANDTGLQLRTPLPAPPVPPRRRW